MTHVTHICHLGWWWHTACDEEQVPMFAVWRHTGWPKKWGHFVCWSLGWTVCFFAQNRCFKDV